MELDRAKREHRSIDVDAALVVCAGRHGCVRRIVGVKCIFRLRVLVRVSHISDGSAEVFGDLPCAVGLAVKPDLDKAAHDVAVALVDRAGIVLVNVVLHGRGGDAVGELMSYDVKTSAEVHLTRPRE